MKKIGNVFILGDSYSTFEDNIPMGFWTWYYRDRRTGTDVESAEQTWWKMLLNDTESNLIQNCSYSGTTICNIGYEGEDCSAKSFVGRINKLVEENYFIDKKINTFFIFGGTNDSWLNSPIGSIKYDNFEKTDLDFSLSAFCYLLNLIKTVCDEVRIIFILNTGLKTALSDGYKTICEHYKIEVVELKDIDKIKGHPSVLGMKQIKEQVCACL